MERTFGIIKPDAVKKNVIGKIIDMIESAGLKIVEAKMLTLTKEKAAEFYAVHSSRPFFNSLVDFIASGPILAIAIEGENAIAKYREIMGATNPAEAAEGTIRAKFAESIDFNAVHGSDAKETAEVELKFFFS